VSEYAFASNGSLSSLGSISAASDPVAIAVGYLGRNVYVADARSDSVSQFAISPGSRPTRTNLRESRLGH